MDVFVRDLKAGELLVGNDGNLCKVADIHRCNDERYSPPMLIGGDKYETMVAYKITMEDGESFFRHPMQSLTVRK